MIKSIALSKFFQETANKGANYFVGSFAPFHFDLIEWIEQCAIFSRDIFAGYRDGVILIRTPNPSGILHDTVELREGDQLIATYESRVPGEDPRKGLKVKRASLPEAISLFFVLYRADVLEETHERSQDTEWEVITVLTSCTDEPEPMHPDTLIANQFELSGGTSTGYNDSEFYEALKTSVIFWKNKAKAVIQ